MSRGPYSFTETDAKRAVKIIESTTGQKVEIASFTLKRDGVEFKLKNGDVVVDKHVNGNDSSEWDAKYGEH